MRGVQRGGHLHSQPQDLIQRQRAQTADPRLHRSLPVVLHDQVRITVVGLPHLQHAHDVRVPGEPAHRALLAQEPLPVLVGFGGEDLHRHRAVQVDLCTAVDDAETTATDFFGVIEPGSRQFRDDGRAHVALRL